MSRGVTRIRALLGLAALVVAGRAAAVDLADGRLSISGNGYWGYGRTGANEYLIGSGTGVFNNAGIAFVVTGKATDSVVAAAQFSLEDGNFGDPPGVDWALVEWRIADSLRLRVGKIKQPIGISMELKDIGTVRPFFTLPTGLYGPTNIASEAYYGAGLTGEVQLGSGWGVGYDAYGGALTVTAMQPESVQQMLSDPTFHAAPEDEQAHDVMGGRVTLLTPIDGLSLRASGYTGSLDAPGEAVHRVNVYGVSAEYLTDVLSLRAEAFRETEGEFERNDTAYVEAAVRLGRHWQVAARLDVLQTTLADFEGPGALLRHREAALGLNYWVAPSFVLKASFHDVSGYRFVLPDPNSALGSTRLFIFGSQFSF